MTFDDVVKQHKAVDWLMKNDPTFLVLMDVVKQSPANAVMVISEWASWIKLRVNEVAQKMEVTDQERVEGYPLPKDAVRIKVVTHGPVGCGGASYETYEKMSLYEITTGFTGCSFERCYVWAKSRERAIEMFREKFPNKEPKQINAVVNTNDCEFITKLDDEGFGDRLKS